jgi:hypothetical protein
MLQYENRRVVDVGDWDELVMATYGRPYNFQQQDGCKDRQSHYITIPVPHPSDYDNDTVPEKVNHDDMGVSFAAWLARDPTQLLDTGDEWDRINGLDLWWARNFYPDVEMVANDLYARGLVEAGEYIIDIDW